MSTTFPWLADRSISPCLEPKVAENDKKSNNLQEEGTPLTMFACKEPNGQTFSNHTFLHQQANMAFWRKLSFLGLWVVIPQGGIVCYAGTQVGNCASSTQNTTVASPNLPKPEVCLPLLEDC